jgi:hypothetical protein
MCLRSQLLRSQVHVGRLRSGAVAEKEVGEDGTGGEEGVVDESLIQRGQKVLNGARLLPLLLRPNPTARQAPPSLKRPSRCPRSSLERLRKVILKQMARRLSEYRLFAAIEVPPVVLGR